MQLLKEFSEVLCSLSGIYLITRPEPCPASTFADILRDNKELRKGIDTVVLRQHDELHMVSDGCADA
jgi:hypothetical protein